MSDSPFTKFSLVAERKDGTFESMDFPAIGKQMILLTFHESTVVIDHGLLATDMRGTPPPGYQRSDWQSGLSDQAILDELVKRGVDLLKAGYMVEVDKLVKLDAD